MNYEKLNFENFHPYSNDENQYNIKDFEKDKKYIAIKQYLNNYFKILSETLYRNSVENFNLKKKIKILKNKTNKNDRKSSYNNSENTLFNESSQESFENLKIVNFDEAKEKENLYLEEDKVEKNEIYKSQKSENLIDNLALISEKKIYENDDFKNKQC